MRAWPRKYENKLKSYYLRTFFPACNTSALSMFHFLSALKHIYALKDIISSNCEECAPGIAWKAIELAVPLHAVALLGGNRKPRAHIAVCGFASILHWVGSFSKGSMEAYATSPNNHIASTARQCCRQQLRWFESLECRRQCYIVHKGFDDILLQLRKWSHDFIESRHRIQWNIVKSFSLWTIREGLTLEL